MEDHIKNILEDLKRCKLKNEEEALSFEVGLYLTNDLKEALKLAYRAGRDDAINKI